MRLKTQANQESSIRSSRDQQKLRSDYIIIFYAYILFFFIFIPKKKKKDTLTNSKTFIYCLETAYLYMHSRALPSFSLLIEIAGTYKINIYSYLSSLTPA